jgi:hypothetical protein
MFGASRRGITGHYQLVLACPVHSWTILFSVLLFMNKFFFNEVIYLLEAHIQKCLKGLLLSQ